MGLFIGILLINDASDFFQSENCEGSKDSNRTAYDVWSKKTVKIECVDLRVLISFFMKE
jgi:hypothetical protein